MNTEHATPALFAALSKAQGEIENATKNAKNPHFRSDYADLAEILNTVRPIFAQHGLSIAQSPSFDGALVSVTTMIAHNEGGYITGTASCVPAKTDAQGIGAATTYLRRYSAAGMAGISQEDDDGQSAAHDRKPEPARQKASQPKPKPQSARAKMVSEFRADMIKEGQANGTAPKDAAEAMKWANAIIKEQAEATNVDLKQVDSWSEEDYSRLTDAVMKAFYAMNADEKPESAPEPEAANA